MTFGAGPMPGRHSTPVPEVFDPGLQGLQGPSGTTRNASTAAATAVAVTFGNHGFTLALSRATRSGRCSVTSNSTRFVPTKSRWPSKAIGSAPMHCGLQSPRPLLSMASWEQQWTPSRWRSVLAHGAEERETEAIRQATQHGMPFGDERFVAHFERHAGRTLAVRAAGRPRLTSSALASSVGSPVG